MNSPEHPSQSFGSRLRFYRNESSDPERGGKLTQERLAEFIGVELGVSYTGAAISDWERGKTRINIEDRAVLLALLRVLVNCAGIQTLDQANELLETGDYRALSTDEEAQLVFLRPESHKESTAAHSLPFEKNRTASIITGGSISSDWTKAFLGMLGEITGRWTAHKIFLGLCWLVLWWLVWQALFPMMNWPFQNVEQARQAGLFTAISTTLAPFLVAALSSPGTDPFWQDQQRTKDVRLYLLAIIGAGTGFQVGYFIGFLPLLVAYNLQIIQPLPFWAALVALLALVFSYASARQVPHNHWHAYGELRLRSGMIFAIFLFFGPLWSVFFVSYYAVLLWPPYGALLTLIAAILLLAFHIRKS